jgi:hypothetical protein
LSCALTAHPAVNNTSRKIDCLLSKENIMYLLFTIYVIDIDCLHSIFTSCVPPEIIAILKTFGAI